MNDLPILVLMCLLQGALMFPAADDGIASHSAKRVKRVIGGTDIEKGQWPWLVSLKGKIPTAFFWKFPVQYSVYFCGGSVLNKRWVLTAAHCFEQRGLPRSKTPKYWHAKVGEVERTHGIFHKIKHYAGIFLGQDDWRLWYLHATKIIIHPDFDATDNWKNDIALVKLEDDLPIDDSDNIGRVILPSQGLSDWPDAEAECIMKGWGCATRDGSVEEVAKATILPAVSDKDCRKVYGLSLNLDTRLCAGHNLEDKGICQGDSGGPLVCRRGYTWVQAGLASFTSANRPGQVPGVFTKVASYTDWIQKTIADNS